MLSAVVHFIADENVVKSESLLAHVQNPETVFTFFTQFYPIEPSYWGQLQNTGPYFKVLNRSGSVAIYFSMYYSRL